MNRRRGRRMAVLLGLAVGALALALSAGWIMNRQTPSGSVSSLPAYSSYLGGAGDDIGGPVAVAAGGSVFVGGVANVNGFAQGRAGALTGSGGFVARLDASGSALVYVRYFPGQVAGLAVDSKGDAYVTGFTSSTKFPVVHPFQRVNRSHNCFPNMWPRVLCNDAFVAKLDPQGRLVYSTYLGGTGEDRGAAIAVDATGAAYVTGYTRPSDFPTVGGLPARMGGRQADGFVAKLSPAGDRLVYSTHLGGPAGDTPESPAGVVVDPTGPTGIGVDAHGDAYITGTTYSADLPVLRAMEPKLPSPYDFRLHGFIAKLNSTGNRLLYSTYFGGSGTDQTSGIAVTAADDAYITGFTHSPDLPTRDAFQKAYKGGRCHSEEGPPTACDDAFVAMLDPQGNLDYSTYLGGTGEDRGTAITVDATGAAYVTGETSSADFPLQLPLQNAYHVSTCERVLCTDAFVAKLDPQGRLDKSTYLGGTGEDRGTGVAVSPRGLVYVVGTTDSSDFPTHHALQSDNAGIEDVFITKLRW